MKERNVIKMSLHLKIRSNKTKCGHLSFNSCYFFWPMVTYPRFQRIFFLIDNEAALKQKKAARTISVHRKKISSGTQGNGNGKVFGFVGG